MKLKKRMNFWKKSRKASLTVEATWIMGLAILWIGILLSLQFYLFSYCLHTQMGCDAILTGISKGYLYGETEEKYAQERWREYLNRYTFGKINGTIAKHGNTCLLTATGEIDAGKKRMLTYSIEVKQKQVEPAKYIRILTALGAV